MADRSIIHVTTNYDKFSMIIANRNTSRNHINNLKRSMQENPDILETQPILVNEKLQIIDGQHRFTAASELGKPIYYTIVEGAGVDMARTMNVLQKQWDPLDFAKSYSVTGHKDYQEYIKAREDFDLPHNVTMAALNGVKSKGLNAIFKRGEFEITDLARGRDWLERIAWVRGNVKIPMISQFAYALLQIFSNSNFEWERFQKLIKTDGDSLQRYSQVPDYLRQLEDLYNKNLSNRVRLF